MKEKTKNYILYVAGCLLTLFILFIALKINDNRKYSMSSISNVNSYLSEIKYDEISTYLIENPNKIIYVSNSSNKESSDFEKKLIPIIKKYNLEDEIIYININNQNIADLYYQNAPELIFYKNGAVSDMIDCNVLKNKKDILKILEERSVISD